MTTLPESYVHDAELTHRAVIEFSETNPEHRPVLRYHGPPDSVYLGTIDGAIACGVAELNDDALDLVTYVTDHAPGATWLMLWCAWELVFPDLTTAPKKGPR